MAEYLDEQLRRAVILVAVLNLAYFWIEFATALTIGSVALLADSADFLEDASVNLLILLRSAGVPLAGPGSEYCCPAFCSYLPSRFFGHSGRKFMHQCRLRRHLSRWWV